MIKFKGINHLAMVTGNMDETIRFWRDLLGMRLVAGHGKPGYRHYFFEISETDMIAFFEWEAAEPVEEKDHGRPVEGPVVFDHVSFSVESKDQLWELKEKLDAAGFMPSEVVDHGFIWSIYTFDPNGIPIEFSVEIPEVDVRKRPVMADREPGAEAQKGAEPDFTAWPEGNPTPPESERKVYPGDGSEFYKAD